MSISTLPPGSERLEKVMAHMGLASRREAKALIESGSVTVNGLVVREPGYAVVPYIDVLVVTTAEIKESYVFYKPRGIETSKTSPSSKDIHDTTPHLRHLSPIGRLDKDSEGLIILSNDGTLAKALTGVNTHVGKTYRVLVREQVSDTILTKMRNGIVIDAIKTKPADTKRMSRTSFDITLFEGRKHQIRRMCDACKLTIESLVRISIGSIEMGTMKPKTYRKLTNAEVASLKT